MLIINGKQAHLYQEKLTEAYRLRHEIFVEEKGWEDIRRSNGLEIDQFDNEHAIHMLHYDDNQLVGYQRLLPTTQPYLLSEVYPELCDEPIPNDCHTWEWTRFAVAKEYRKGGRKLSRVGNLLLSGIVEWGLANDVDSVVIEMNPVWLLRLVQLRFKVYPLGFSKNISGEETLAVRAIFNQQTLEQLQEFRGDNEHVLTPELAHSM